jgi:fermentation-respiration switch protein FrsA (DUF1100 family)
MLRKSSQFVLRWSRIALAGYLCLILLLSMMESSLIFFPAKYPRGNWDIRWPNVEDAEFTATDGTRLHGWFAEHPQPRAVILMAHGNGGNIAHRAFAMKTLRDELRCSVLMFDYRGYGKSEGEPTEAGVLEDARAARAWLAKRARIEAGDIVLMGGSLGTGVMVDLAAADGARGLVLNSAYTSLPDVAAAHYSWIPVHWLMKNRLDSLSKIPNYRGPLLQFHSDADDVIPYDCGQRLFTAAGSSVKRFVTMNGVPHGDSPGPEFYRHLDEFLKQLAPAPEASKSQISRR